MNQLSFFDLQAEQRCASLVPRFKSGDDIFLLSLDVVEQGKVSHCFICDEHGESPYYGYHVDFPNGLHSTAWDTEINLKAFHTAKQAQIKADAVSKQLTKIEPSELEYFDAVGFEYVRKSDNYVLTAGVAKVGETQLYEYKFMCYHFLRELPNAEKRDREYTKLVKELQAEGGSESQTDFAPEVLYKAASGVYASRGYVEHNGAYISDVAQEIENNLEGGKVEVKFEDNSTAIGGNTYSIYQLKSVDETRGIRFESYEYLQTQGLTLDPTDYELIYTAPLENGMNLEGIYEKFNIDHPADFTGHSLSVSDVVVLHQDGQNTAHYVDHAGFKETPEFLQPVPQRLFVDMDGTLAVFTPTNRLEDLYEKGYFENLAPMQNVVDAVKVIIKEHPGIEVNVLSAHLSDSPYALTEKNKWLDKHLPEVDAAHRIFPPCGQDKANYIPGGLRTTDYLLDDYTKNLAAWEPPAKGIKVLNGINHTHGTWKSACLRFDKPARELAENVTDIMKGVERIVDNAPQKSVEVTKEIDLVTAPTEINAKTDNFRTLENQTTIDVIRQQGNAVMLRWHYPTGATEYSVHNIDAAGKGVNNGSYFDEDEIEDCETRFTRRAEGNIETAEGDFSGFSYLYEKGKINFAAPVLSEASHESQTLGEAKAATAEPVRLQRITSFVREIMLQGSPTGDSQYFGYCNGKQETEGYDTINELIEQNEHYSQTDVSEHHAQDYNVCNLYYSDGSVKRISGKEHDVDFTKMPAEKLKAFTDDFLKPSQAAANPAQHISRPRVTEQQIDIAKNTNLVAFLQGRGYDLYPSGGWYRWREHPSLAVHEDGRWAWHSQNLKGGPIDFLMKCENMEFVAAVEQLSGSMSTYVPNLESKRREDAELTKPPMKLPPADKTGARATAYLIKTRGLDPQIVKELMKDKLIYESADYHNAVFVGYDSSGAAKYAAQRGTLTNTDNPFKRDVLNSDKSYAFQLRGTSATRVAVFESAIDAISHKSIQKTFGQDYNSINRISLGGVADKALDRYLTDNPQITDIVIATDNDEAGHSAAESLMQKYKDLGYTVSRMTPKAKDFNNDLIAIRDEQERQALPQTKECAEDVGADLELG